MQDSCSQMANWHDRHLQAYTMRICLTHTFTFLLRARWRIRHRLMPTHPKVCVLVELRQTKSLRTRSRGTAISSCWWTCRTATLFNLLCVMVLHRYDVFSQRSELKLRSASHDYTDNTSNRRSSCSTSLNIA